MKKQILFVAIVALTVPAALFAPAYNPGAQKETPASVTKQVAGGQTFTGAAAVATQFTDSANLIAGALAEANITPGADTTSAAYQAGQAFIKNGGTVNVSSTGTVSTNSKKLGRLGRK